MTVVKQFFAEMPMAARVGMAIILINLFVVLFAPLLAPYGETQLVTDVWAQPNSENLLGGDQLGRDMLTRIIYGARTTITIAFIATMLSFVMGIVAGFTAAVVGGVIDMFLSRVVEALMAIPTLILALVVISVLGTELYILVAVIAVLDSTRVFRLSRAIAMDVAVMEYVEAARLRGEGLWWIMTREVLPNTVMPLVAEFGLRFAFAFLFIASLSFLGLGIQPPLADWGGMVRENASVINFGGAAPLYPAAAIAVLAVGVNLLVDYVLARANRSAAAEFEG
ncbi:MAG: ABC transporter permease [Rhodospirillaceae bacterium]|nr:ABC transporter permease [Rhodospirillaceae bacterium]